MLMSMTGSEKGTYILIMKAEKTTSIMIGKLGMLNIQPGFYTYVGSAFGSGGLKARINHHMKIARRPHWHIDYLRKEIDLIKIVFDDSGERLEYCWAITLEKMPVATIPLVGFGSSDCAAVSHLFYFKKKPDLTELRSKEICLSN